MKKDDERKKIIPFIKENHNQDQEQEVEPEEETEIGIMKITGKDLKDVIAKIPDIINDEEKQKIWILARTREKLVQAFKKDKVTKLMEILDFNGNLMRTDLKRELKQKGDRFTVSITREDEIVYVGYIEATGQEDDPYGAEVLKVNTKTKEAQRYLEKGEWEKTESPILEVAYGPMASPEIEEEDRNAYQVLGMFLSYHNALEGKLGLTKKQDESIKKLAPVYNENMGLIDVEMNGGNLLLVPLDSKWNGFAIGINEENELQAYFHIKTKDRQETTEDNIFGEEFYGFKSLLYPIKTKDQKAETMNELITLAQKERRGKYRVTTIPISEETFLTGEGRTVKEVIDSLTSNGCNINKQDIRVKMILKLLNEMKEEEFINE